MKLLNFFCSSLKALKIVAGCECPICVATSGSMEPALHRGDLLFVTNYNYEHEDIRVGDIVVFKVSTICPHFPYFITREMLSWF